MRLPLPFVLLTVSLAFSAGCESEPLPAAEQPPQATAPGAGGVNYDPASCGTITGLVTWVGAVPEVAPVLDTIPRPGGGGYETAHLPLANAPRIDRFTRGVDGAVVFLREVDTARAKPWDLPPVAVEFRDSQLVVQQGERAGRAGFVRRGNSITLNSAEDRFHILRGRGAAFFSFPFPDANSPRAQTLDHCGRVELTCAAGCYWQAAHVFVCDHPYYAVTDAAGAFRFTHVPAGKYDLVVWHPGWTVERTERNPESGLPFRLVYGPALETSRPVLVTAGGGSLANLTLPK